MELEQQIQWRIYSLRATRFLFLQSEFSLMRYISAEDLLAIDAPGLVCESSKAE